MSTAQPIETQSAAAAAAARFVAIDAEQILDTSTGLIWTRGNVPGGRMTWAQARAECDVLDLGDVQWRLPTISELLTIVDYGRTDPAIDTDAFPDCKPSWYWSATPFASSPGDYAWGGYFGSGYAYWTHHDSVGFVRACRASQ